MKKKNLKIAGSIVVAIILLTVLVLGVTYLSGNQLTTARCIVRDNGALYMVYDGRPVKLNYGKETDYQTGDKLLIIHQSAFAESDPEQCRAYFIVKIGSGTENDIPQSVFDVFKELQIDVSATCGVSHLTDASPI